MKILSQSIPNQTIYNYMYFITRTENPGFYSLSVLLHYPYNKSEENAGNAYIFADEDVVKIM
jgi:hypothetical protein